MLITNWLSTPFYSYEHFFYYILEKITNKEYELT